VLGKGEERLRIQSFALSCIFALSTVVPASGIEIRLNGNLVRHWEESRLERLSYRVPTESGFSSGISLDEILPLCTSAYHLAAFNASDQRIILEEEDLADNFASWYLVASPRGNWDLVIGEKRLPEVRKIEILGEPLADKQLEIWVSWEGIQLLKKEIERFSNLHALAIKVTEVPRIETKLISILRAGGHPPDVVMVQSDYLPDLVQSRAIQSLDYLSFETLIPKGKRSFLFGGKRWAVPFYFDCQLVFYNPGLVDGPPALSWTLEDMERLAEGARSRSPDVAPMNWNAYSAYWLAAFQLGFGKQELVEADGSIRIDDPATRAALSYLLELQERGLLVVSEREAMISLFASEQVAMILSGSYSIPLFEELGIPFGIAPYPRVRTEGRSLAPMLDFKGWAISRRTYNPVLARRIIQYLSGIGVQQRFPVAMSKLPANEYSWEIMKQDNPYFPVLRASAETGVPVPTHRAYGIYKNTMWKLLRFVFSGQMSVSGALEQGQRIIEAQLE
jgi:ABC-type glycerol-3-phosphate transport system substrate-binding protein